MGKVYEEPLAFAGLTRMPVGLSYNEMYTGTMGSPASWRCLVCGKHVTNRWHHYHTHTAQRCKCSYCPSTFSRIDTLRTHIRSKHKECLRKKALTNAEMMLGRRRQLEITQPAAIAMDLRSHLFNWLITNSTSLSSPQDVMLFPMPQ